MYQLEQADIKNCTDPGSFTRGRQYFKQNKVGNLYVDTINGNQLHIQSTVQGRNRFPYEQQITIIYFKSGMVDIDGICSCPVEFNCKHVVATCLEYQSEYQFRNNTIIQAPDSLSWLDKFVDAGLMADNPKIESREFIAYILQPSNKPAVITVKLIVIRCLKKGGFGKGRKVHLYNISEDYMRPAYAQDSDTEIAKLIEYQDDVLYGSSQVHELYGELGYLALGKILNTNRCYWQDTNKPALSHGSDRDLQLRWQTKNNNDRQLVIEVQPEAIILNTLPALYIDPDAGVIGSIVGANFTLEQWQMLLDRPVVSEQECSEFSQQLLIKLPGLSLPLPKKMDITTIEQQQPVAKLFLFSQASPINKQAIHKMRLRFSYGGFELSFLPASNVRNLVEDNQILSIQRNLTAEQSAISQLYDSGFILIPDEQTGDIVFTTSPDTDLMDAASCWQQFLEETLSELEAQGWQVEFDIDFHLQFLTIDEWDVEIESDTDWFELRFDLDIQGHKIPLLPLIAEVMNNYDLDQLPETLLLPLPTSFTLGDSQFLKIPADRIRPIYEILYELYDSNTLDNDGKLRLSRFDATRLAELEENCFTELHWRGGKAMRELGRKLKDFTGIKKVAPARGLKATLRDYQQQGLNWLQFLRKYEFNGILADDMGLGKTVQTLAHLLLEKEKKRMDKPCLILAPTSLMSNWLREAQQFTPKLRVLILQGPERHQHFKSIPDYDLIISTYPLLVRDQEILLAQEYHYLILDEAQMIKNPRAKAALVARKITTRHRLCLTGTPMENHLGELWALFDFLMPGFLGDTKLFKQRFRTPIEKQNDNQQRQRLVRRITPFLLRRTKTEVLAELPAKTEIIRSIPLGNKQSALYESIRLSMEKKVRDAINKKGLARSHITILDALLKLRQVCCDPKLLPLAQAKKINESAKLDMLMEMVLELLEEGRRILLFSQFTKMLAIIELKFKEHKISYSKLTGQTRKRDEVIEQFRQGDTEVFLISLKAGGVGLNLVEADTVIHYDPWWNPAVENQATDRAHRIGQNKAVFVYKLITENTLEEKIIAMQAKKQALANGVYQNGKQGEDLKLNANDLQELFLPLDKK